MSRSVGQSIVIGLAATAGLFVAGVVAASVVEDAAIKRAVPKPTSAWSKIAHDADHKLYADLKRIAANPRIPKNLRQLAQKGAQLIHQHWLKPGYAGYGIERSQSTLTLYNWCGANYGRGPCINVIDCACRDHDLARQQAFG